MTFVSDAKAVGMRIRQVRGDATQAEFAESTGISQSAIVKYEAGRIPKGDELCKIAGNTNVSIDWLLTGEGPMRRGEEEVSNVTEPGAQYGVPGGLSAFEAKLIALFRRLPAHKQKRFPGLVAFLADEDASDFMLEIKELEKELAKETGKL